MAKWDIVLVAGMVALLLVVDVLTFHDLAEPHTTRDWLTLVASILVFAYVLRAGYRRWMAHCKSLRSEMAALLRSVGAWARARAARSCRTRAPPPGPAPWP